ncbi:MAG: LTA synthase family protein [Gemmatimonadales bacterium]
MSLALLLVVVCALEAWLVQGKTLLAPQAQGGLDPVVDLVLRFGFDLLAFGALTGLLPRLLVAAAFVAAVVFYVFVLVYHDYFQQPLSILIVLNQRREGALVTDAGFALLRPWHLLFVGTLALKLLLLFSAADSTPTLHTGLLCAGLYLLALLVVNRVYKPLAKIATWETVGGLGAVYGYLPAWAAEYAFIDSKALLVRALARAGETSDRLTPIETPAPVADRVVFLQVESLDWAVLDFRIRGEEVTPAINRHARRGMTYAVQADKRTGSLDADFTMLMGRPPSADVPTYKIQGYPYAGSLIQRLRELGFATTSVHGVSGEFFSRRPAFEKMGFDRLIFREEFERMAAAPVAGWSVPDDDLLQFAAMDFSAQSGRQFQLAITATSHIPFHNYDRTLARFFPGSASIAENYFDVIHYVDRAVGRYLDALPQETTVVLYGDHVSKVEHEGLGYRQAMWGGVGLVPFIVLETGRDLSRLQRTGAESRDGHLTLLDTVTWLHASVDLLRDIP